jgi:hypothetical protein
MKIQFFIRKQINSQQWDNLLAQSPQSSLYAFSWYLDIVSPNWAALIALQGNDYQVVMPLPIAKNFGMAYIKQPLFCQQLGIFSKNTSIEQATMESFVAKVLQHFSYIASYHFNIQNPISFPLAAKAHEQKQEIYYTHLVSLEKDKETLQNNYNADRKMNLKRGLKTLETGTTSIKQSLDIASLSAMFAQEVAHKIKGGVAKNAYNLLEKLFKALIERNLATLYYTVNELGQQESGALFAVDKQKIIYLFNAGFEEFRKKNGRTLLLDKVLTENANQKKLFDFESPEVPNIASFYASFGAEIVPFLHWHHNNLPCFVQFLKEWRKRRKLL